VNTLTRCAEERLFFVYNHRRTEEIWRTIVAGRKLTDRFAFERDLIATGITNIAGVDEVGRGPLAGPVLAAAVILPQAWYHSGMPKALRKVNDSKQLTPEERETFHELLVNEPELRHATAQVDADGIDATDILLATHRAMIEALAKLDPAPQHVLVDGLRVRSIRLPQTPLVKGDSRSYSIAAASIIAKVTRDRLMLEFDRLYPEYGFLDHKGYGTEQHLEAIGKHGPCPIHRISFAPFRPRLQTELFEFRP
jgi:ribonuclease HII